MPDEPEKSIIPGGASLPARAVAQAANAAAARGVFADYAARKAHNTLRRQAADLLAFSDFLTAAGLPALDLMDDPAAWAAITWGLVAAFQKWMLRQGFAIATCNQRLSTIKVYAGLAASAGTLSTEELALIRLMRGYSHNEARRVDEKRREAGRETRRGPKKAEPVGLTPEQARALKAQPDTPQGRRDALLACLLLDHGLRCGEAALLRVEHIDLVAGEMRFHRPKVDKVQVHRLSPDTLRAARAYLTADYPQASGSLSGPLLLGSVKGGKLRGGMSERAITKRIAHLGAQVGLPTLSAHDCRHYWATQAARSHTPLDRLKDAGGWNSLAMPGRYIEDAKIANEGVRLGGELSTELSTDSDTD